MSITLRPMLLPASEALVEAVCRWRAQRFSRKPIFASMRTSRTRNAASFAEPVKGVEGAKRRPRWEFRSLSGLPTQSRTHLDRFRSQSRRHPL